MATVIVLSLIALLIVACSDGVNDNIEQVVFPTTDTSVAAQSAPPPNKVTDVDGNRLAIAGDSVVVHYRGTLDLSLIHI